MAWVIIISAAGNRSRDNPVKFYMKPKHDLKTALHRHRHDIELLGLVVLLLLSISGYLVDGFGHARQEGASWRHIDTDAVRKLIDAGNLNDREALWYHPTEGEPRHEP